MQHDQDLEKVIGPAWLIDAASVLLLAANCAGWSEWGLAPNSVPVPFAIDRSTPALHQLLALSPGPLLNGARQSVSESLTFWTSHGVRKIACRVQTVCAAGTTERPAIFLVRAESTKFGEVELLPSGCNGKGRKDGRASVGTCRSTEGSGLLPLPTGSAAPMASAADLSTLSEIGRRIRDARIIERADSSGADRLSTLASSVAGSDGRVQANTANTASAGHAVRQLSDGPVLEAKVAHELRTPLSAVISLAEVLRQERFGPLANPRYRGYVEDIYESARHALNVVDGLLANVRQGTGMPKLAFAELDATEIVEICLAVVRPLAEKANMNLSADLAPRLPHLVADPVSLKQMLLNLLSNAIKFGRLGDRISVITAYETDGPLRITVVDTGPGMTTNKIAFALEGHDGHRKYNRKNVNGSLGLGLPLTKALAEANGACLTIDSQLGQGTRATLTFARDRVVPI
jgi:two-component system, cell cycle sensor histidine kinase PleC